jgi:hypothetical protein
MTWPEREDISDFGLQIADSHRAPSSIRNPQSAIRNRQEARLRFLN